MRKAPPEWVPVYPGELQAIADVEAQGWTVYWHDTEFGHYGSPTAIHPTNHRSPMHLTAFETGDGLRWWWRPMVRIVHQGTPVNYGRDRSEYRVETYKPRLPTPENVDSSTPHSTD